MLLPVQCECGRRIWVDFEINYEKYIYTGSLEELQAYILKKGHVRSVHSDEEISRDVKRTLLSLLKEIPKEKAIEEVSLVYGIPHEFVEEILENLLIEETI